MNYFMILIALLLVSGGIAIMSAVYFFQYLVCRKRWGLPRFVSKCLVGNAPGEGDMYDQQVAAAKKQLESQEMEPLVQQSQDGLILRGHLWRGDASCNKVILAVHGCRSSGMTEFCFVAPYYHEQGYHICLIDQRTCGASEGDYMGYGYLESDDMALWTEQLAVLFGTDCEIYLQGISMGAATVLMMSHRLLPQQVRGIIAECSYTSIWEEFAYQLKTSFHLPTFPILHLTSRVCRIRAKYSLRQAAPMACVKQSRLPILFVHGGKDDFVPTDMVYALYDACPTFKGLLVIEDALHARGFYTDSRQYQEAIEQFLAGNYRGD
ncbi:MAG: alpha/beta hydrolase [Cellulosilyticaceae bacterium]